MTCERTSKTCHRLIDQEMAYIGPSATFAAHQRNQQGSLQRAQCNCSCLSLWRLHSCPPRPQQAGCR